jgi:proteasome lid subunit RPN8/RPN11
MTGLDIPGLDGVRERIYRHVFPNDDHEVGGVLVGYLRPGLLPEVTGAIEALEAEGRRASVTFTHDAWSSIHAALERDYPGQDIVGWYHSHPGFGIFLSQYDLFIHQNFFSDPRHIAYVVDPHAGTEGVFVWRDSEIKPLFDDRRTDWEATGRQILDVAEPPLRRPPEEPGSRRFEPRAAADDEGEWNLRNPWVAGGLLLLVVLAGVILVNPFSGGQARRVPARHQAHSAPHVTVTTPRPPLRRLKRRVPKASVARRAPTSGAIVPTANRSTAPNAGSPTTQPATPPSPAAPPGVPTAPLPTVDTTPQAPVTTTPVTLPSESTGRAPVAGQ